MRLLDKRRKERQNGEDWISSLPETRLVPAWMLSLTCSIRAGFKQPTPISQRWRVEVAWVFEIHSANSRRSKTKTRPHPLVSPWLQLLGLIAGVKARSILNRTRPQIYLLAILCQSPDTSWLVLRTTRVSSYAFPTLGFVSDRHPFGVEIGTVVGAGVLYIQARYRRQRGGGKQYRPLDPTSNRIRRASISGRPRGSIVEASPFFLNSGRRAQGECTKYVLIDDIVPHAATDRVYRLCDLPSDISVFIPPYVLDPAAHGVVITLPCAVVIPPLLYCIDIYHLSHRKHRDVTISQPDFQFVSGIPTSIKQWFIARVSESRRTRSNPISLTDSVGILYGYLDPDKLFPDLWSHFSNTTESTESGVPIATAALPQISTAPSLYLSTLSTYSMRLRPLASDPIVYISSSASTTAPSLALDPPCALQTHPSSRSDLEKIANLPRESPAEQQFKVI
ncbi:hypothetical protein B0H19DRAFT_1286479 [Mycena capillaripes]|nr:hypothetical protein B0H19DRAFT_1286479 [Mycena capillaripes]